MTPDEFRKFGHRLIDWIADYREGVAERPVMSRVRPGDVKAQLPAEAPQQAESFDSILADVERIIMPGLSHWQHPGFFAYFPINSRRPACWAITSDRPRHARPHLAILSSADRAGRGGDRLVAPDGRPVRRLERGDPGHRVDEHPGRPAMCPRTDHATRCEPWWPAGGRASADRSIARTQSHSSVDKAAPLAGFGRANLRHVAHDDAFALRPDELRRVIEAEIAAGMQPCAIIATTGTTATTALDPVEATAAIAREHELWLHVDAAMAGSAMILPECRWMWQGIEERGFAGLQRAQMAGRRIRLLALLRARSAASGAGDVHQPQLSATAADAEVKNLRDSGIPLGRRFRALKLWFLLREQGVAGLQARLRRDIANAHWLAGEVKATPDWQVLAPVPLQTVCVRHDAARAGLARRWIATLRLGSIGSIARATPI